jgi:hypothetical protein
VLSEFEENKIKNAVWTDAKGMNSSLTYVKPTRVDIDEEGLAQALTPEVFDRYTVRKLDKAKMEKAMDTGEIDPAVVAPYVLTRVSKPYLKYSMSSGPKNESMTKENE